MNPEKKGSSPLARGLQKAALLHLRESRIIPARAGFTTRLTSTDRSGTDHPRSRGVYPGAGLRHLYQQGSSPLARGLPRAQCRGRRGRGIIPARAGFTSSVTTTPPSRGDHPRSRGVYVQMAMMLIRGAGSSPLARGLRAAAAAGPAAPGIIPARAGFTALLVLWWVRSTDHPRSRGVYGTLGGLGLLGLRIIPARAGFTG